MSGRLSSIFMVSCLLIASCSLPEPDDITPPLLQVIYPYEGAVVSDNVEVAIDAWDDDAVEKVWCYVDGQKIGEANSAPFKVQLPVANYEQEINHVLLAAAMDKSGNIGYSATVNFTIAESQDIVDPTVVILNPQGGQVVEGIVHIIADARDDRSVQKVRFYIDGQLVDSTSAYPYMYNWDTGGYSDSTAHTIYAEAIDGGNNNAFSPVITVTVYPRSGEAGDNIAPRAVFLWPLTGAVVTGTVQVSVDLLDNDMIQSAAFYVDGQLVQTSEEPESPWIFTWDTSPYADGNSHSLYVKVFDRAGNVGTSGLIVVTVQ